ncbi:penicillin amidase [Tenacibaculum adriaticum]|uniref:Penicillin amidase n=1 Tax=Tenacibaculum adriaticum TaxID=413713 RepID=A0A5S5DYT5_9FLAO|nr:penicillin acylase family protein [Tenacibaculum adriaticum]TYQ00399.1 penicillin amidase [Tenacibaculum adriaticum]
MKLLKKLFKIVLILIALLFVGGWLFTVTLHPKYNGELELSNLSEKVTVFYDEVGVPHINAKNQKDAFRAFGYVHAQDRLWQMEVIRRISAGRLSEIFGKDVVRVDKFMSGLGIEEAAYKTIADIDKNSEPYKLTMAYLDGINQFIEKGPTPLEFYLVGVEKEKYTINDIYNVFGYMAFSFAVAHKTDPLLNEIKEKLGAEYLEELGIPLSETTLLKNTNKREIKAEFSLAVNEIMDKLPIPSFIGSNSWVLGSNRTKNGKVIFANDPHINFGQPSVWYQSHIKTPDYEMYGFNLALTPFPLLGHNRNHAYGLTMFENDDIDFYIEENNPENALEYKTPEGFLPYKTIDKDIKIKGRQNAAYQIKVSKHGPIMNGIIEHLQDERPIAMKWIYTHLPNKLLDVAYEMSHAENLQEFKNGASKLHAPGLNMMYGDASNNIAWFAAGKLYKYRDILNRKIYLNGASGKDEIVRYLDFEENPQAVNPAWGYVYSANNQPDSIANMLYSGYYLPEDRAKRIVEIVEPKHDFTKEDVAKMIYDVKSSVAPKVILNATEVITVDDLSVSERKALEILKKWDGNYFKTEVAPTIYNRFVYEFLVNTFKDEMGKGFKQFMDGTMIQKKMIAVQMSKSQSVWWDDVTTEGKIEDKKEIITKSFKNAISFLNAQLGENVEDWTWNRVTTVEHEHPIGKAGGLLRKIFNVGPFETNGGNEVLNNHIFKLDSTGYYKVTGGPSTRRIIDFSDIENSITIIPTGQSGNVFSDHYKDQAQKYLDGKFVKMKLNQKEIEQSENRLVFLPKK